jgi:hypothetical protein
MTEHGPRRGRVPGSVRARMAGMLSPAENPSGAAALRHPRLLTFLKKSSRENSAEQFFSLRCKLSHSPWYKNSGWSLKTEIPVEGGSKHGRNRSFS